MYGLNASSDILHMKFIIALKTAVRLIPLYKLYVKKLALILMETCHKSWFLK